MIKRTIACFLLLTAAATAGEVDCTKWIVANLPEWQGGDIGYDLPSGKQPDIVTDALVVEVERCNRKWFESIGQAMCYWLEVSDKEPHKVRKPCVVLLRTESTADDAAEVRTIADCQRVCDACGIVLVVVTPPAEVLNK